MSEGPEILVACALKKEAAGLREGLPPGTRIVNTGIGSDRTLHSLEELFERKRPAALIFTGMAGQLDPALGLGDFVLPSGWCFESGTRFDSDPELLARLREAGCSAEGLGITVRTPVVKAASRLRLYRETGARICDMESAAALMISQAYRIPCLAPKVVSDTADSGMLAFYRHFGRNIESLRQQIQGLLALLSRAL